MSFHPLSFMCFWEKENFSYILKVTLTLLQMFKQVGYFLFLLNRRATNFTLFPSCRKKERKVPILKGVEKKTCTFENHSDETVSPAKNMLEGWFI